LGKNGKHPAQAGSGEIMDHDISVMVFYLPRQGAARQGQKTARRPDADRDRAAWIADPTQNDGFDEKRRGARCHSGLLGAIRACLGLG
jgi:hypothetical protein